MGCCDSLSQLLRLSAWCCNGKGYTYFFDLSIQFPHLFDPTPVIIRASDGIHSVPEVRAEA